MGRPVKYTPIERLALGLKPDRKEAYRQRLADKGFKRVGLLVHVDDEAALREFASSLLKKRKGDD